MSEELKKVQLPLQAVGQAPQETQEEPQEEAKSIDAADFACGYFAGITHEGAFLFQPMGKNAGLPELLDVHSAAGSQLKKSELIGQHNELNNLRQMLQFMNGNLIRLSGQMDELEKKLAAK